MEFRIEKASPDDYQLFADMIQNVWDQMEQKEWFMADTAEFTYKMLTGGQGVGYKAIDQETGRTAGVFMVVIPGLDPENLGLDIGFPEEDLMKVAHMDSVAVLPQYRGQGLQYRLMQAAEADLRSQGYRYLMCTIHPRNQYSLNNVLKQGYRVVTEKEKHGGYLRAILLKDLAQTQD